MSKGGRVVCVTGASGFIASWLVKLLLQRGYTVRASIRNPSDPQKTEHLLALDGAKTRLELFKAELLEECSFDRVVDGCECVFHTASPVQLSFATDPQAELIDPAVKGTLNVLRSCAKASVKRVVLTSSLAAVTFNERMLIPGVVFDETWFSDHEFCEKSKFWYMLSKTLAEEAAWKYAKEHDINMVSLCPGWVIGPILQPTANVSVEVVLNLINGSSKSFPDVSYRWVDVRDVADAHIRAFEDSSASGRYCLVDRSAHVSELAEILRPLYPELDIPDRCEGVSSLSFKYHVDNTKAKGLGVVFTPLEVSLKDTVECLIEKKLHTIGTLQVP